MKLKLSTALVLLIAGTGACSGPAVIEDGSGPLSTGLDLTLSAPAATQDFKVGIDGGAIGSQPRVILVPAGGGTTATVTIPLPPGGPYRVRAIARRAGMEDGPGWATGKATELLVEEDGFTDVAVSVEPYSVEITAPEMVTRGEVFTVRWRYFDPGDVLEDGGTFGSPAGAVHYSLSGVRDGGGDRTLATGERVGEGEYEMSATLVAPLADPGSLYFRVVGYTFGNLVQPVPISLFDPSSARGEDARAVTIL